MRLLPLFLLSVACWAQLVAPSGFPAIFYPEPNQGGTAGSCTLNDVSANDECVFVFHARATSSGAGLTDLRFYISTVTSAQDVSIRLETVAADGTPSGTLAWTNASYTLASASVTTGYKDVTLTAAGAVTLNDSLAMRITFSGTAGNIVLSLGTSSGVQDGRTYYLIKDAGGAYTRGANLTPAAHKIDGTWYANSRMGGRAPLTQSAAMTSSSCSGNHIVASDWTARATGIRWYVASMGTGNELTGYLYQGGTQLAVTSAYDTDQYASGSTVTVFMPFTTSPIIQRGQQLRFVVCRSSGSTGTTATSFYSSASAADMSQFEYGTNIYGVTWDGASTWTEYNTRRYLVGLVLDAFYGGASAPVVVQ